MAEEKQTKKTTTPRKPRTTKVVKEEVKEEVKVEKRFCTKCGKELKNGEICGCANIVNASTPSTPAVAINSDALAATAKSALSTINNVFKKPDTTINEETNKKDSTISIVLIISLAITFALYLMSLVSNSVNIVADVNYGLTIVANNISYLKVFVYGILMYAIMAVIPMFAAFVIGKITKNSNLTFKKVFKLYTISNAPLIYGYLGLAIIMVIDISLLNVLGFLTVAAISIFCFFNFLLSFNKETTIRDDRRSWALTSLMGIWIVIEIIAIIIIIGSIGVDSVDKINSNYPYGNSTNSGWNW